MALGSFAAAFEKINLPPYTRVRWRGIFRCGALATKVRNSMVVETRLILVSRMSLYASPPIAYDGTVYARIDAARWSRDSTKL